MKLTNRTVLITGGATGIGFALARQLVARHNQVIICGRSQSSLEKAREQLASIETVQCDINRCEDLNRLVSFLSAKYPQLDTLVNNAGIQQSMNFCSNTVTDQAINNEINTNLTAHITITQRLLPLLSANQNATIIFTGSALGLVPKFSAPVYSAAKAGIHNFVQSLRHQCKQARINVIEIFPDVVKTAMTSSRNETSLMDADDFAANVIHQLSKGRKHIFVGRTKILDLLNRWMPEMALKIVNKNAGG